MSDPAPSDSGEGIFPFTGGFMHEKKAVIRGITAFWTAESPPLSGGMTGTGASHSGSNGAEIVSLYVCVAVIQRWWQKQRFCESGNIWGIFCFVFKKYRK